MKELVEWVRDKKFGHLVGMLGGNTVATVHDYEPRKDKPRAYAASLYLPSKSGGVGTLKGHHEKEEDAVQQVNGEIESWFRSIKPVFLIEDRTWMEDLLNHYEDEAAKYARWGKSEKAKWYKDEADKIRTMLYGAGQ